MLADLASESTGPNSSLSSRLSLTIAFPQHLLTAFFCQLLSSVFPGTLPSLVFFWFRRKSLAQALYVGFMPKQTKESSDWHSPTPIETNAQHQATYIYIYIYIYMYIYMYICVCVCVCVCVREEEREVYLFL